MEKQSKKRSKDGKNENTHLKVLPGTYSLNDLTLMSSVQSAAERSREEGGHGAERPAWWNKLDDLLVQQIDVTKL